MDNNSNQNKSTQNNQSIDQVAMDTLIATKAGGLITKKLVELGEKQLINDNNSIK